MNFKPEMKKVSSRIEYLLKLNGNSITPDIEELFMRLNILGEMKNAKSTRARSGFIK